MTSLERFDQAVRTWNLKRKHFPALRAALPDAIDTLALIMQAGLDFQVALAYYVNEGAAGPLRDEFDLVQKEIQLGFSRPQALERLAARVPEESVRELVLAITQGIELGTSLAPLLRQQAQRLRQRRLLDAERRAAQAPLKLLFPLLVFIFPTVLLILVGPILLSIAQQGGL